MESLQIQAVAVSWGRSRPLSVLMPIELTEGRDRLSCTPPKQLQLKVGPREKSPVGHRSICHFLGIPLQQPDQPSLRSPGQWSWHYPGHTCWHTCKDDDDPVCNPAESGPPALCLLCPDGPASITLPTLFSPTPFIQIIPRVNGLCSHGVHGHSPLDTQVLWSRTTCHPVS